MDTRLPSPSTTVTIKPAEMAEVSRLLYQDAGIVLGPGKESMVLSRLTKRMRVLKLPDVASYLALVRSDKGKGERGEMLSALTTNVTQFFREDHHFKQLRKDILPPLLERARKGGRIRIWSAGCSNGSEAYSTAMTLCDAAPDIAKLDVKIIATDIDPQMTAAGRAATYDSGVLAQIPPEFKRRFIETDGTKVTMAPAVRALVSFSELNLHGRWPHTTPFDVIFCRNVVIYFDADAQKALWRRFEAALAPRGWLFVGHSERVTLTPESRLQPAGITAYTLSGS